MLKHFNADNFIIKLDLLDENTKPFWGKMSAQHMIEHLYFVLKLSCGKLPINVPPPNDKAEKIKNIFLLSDKPFQKNFINPITGENLLPLQNNSFSDAVSELKKSINLFNDYFIQNPEATHTHPVFGTLNQNEWIAFHQKHFHHHFSQFGLI